MYTSGPCGAFCAAFRALRRPQKTNGHDSSEINGRRPMRTEQHRPFGGAAGRTAPPEHKRAGRTQPLWRNDRVAADEPSPTGTHAEKYAARPLATTVRQVAAGETAPPEIPQTRTHPALLAQQPITHRRRQTGHNRNTHRKVRRQRSPSPRQQQSGTPPQANRPLSKSRRQGRTPPPRNNRSAHRRRQTGLQRNHAGIDFAFCAENSEP